MFFLRVLSYISPIISSLTETNRQHREVLKSMNVEYDIDKGIKIMYFYIKDENMKNPQKIAFEKIQINEIFIVYMDAHSRPFDKWNALNDEEKYYSSISHYYKYNEKPIHYIKSESKSGYSAHITNEFLPARVFFIFGKQSKITCFDMGIFSIPTRLRQYIEYKSIEDIYKELIKLEKLRYKNDYKR